jgi:hypothetical protein
VTRKSTILAMEPAIKQEFDERIDCNQYTIDDLVEWLDEVSPETVPSRSAVGRYVKKRRARGRAVEMLADAVVGAVDEDNEAVDLMLELATLRMREVKVLDRLRELGAL